jgi:hypothetical protein
MANFNRAKKYHFIYKTTCLLNDKYYIGMHSTNELNDGYLGSGKRLRNMIRKYGKENFKLEILEYLSDRCSLVEKEKEIVNQSLLQDLKCINLKTGGNGGFISDEQQLRRSIAGTKRHKYLFETDIDYRTTYLKNFKAGIEKLYQSGHYNKKHTVATKSKIKLSMKGKGVGNTNSQFGSFWITNGLENKKTRSEDIPDGWRKGRVLS